MDGIVYRRVAWIIHVWDIHDPPLYSAVWHTLFRDSANKTQSKDDLQVFTLL